MDEQRPIAGKQRISCGGLCRIRDAGRRYLLGLNANRLAQGQRLYTAIGGALRYADPDFLARFGALEEEPGTHDLRLFLDPARLDAFRAWFARRVGRETDIFRELREELVDEFNILSSLMPSEAEIAYASSYETQRITGRQGVNGVLTHYFHEIYDVAFAPPVQAVLLDAAPETGLRWFDEAEVRQGITSDGAIIDGAVLL